MSDRMLIAVLGATGAQGGSVLNHLLNSGNYRVRGLTRNPTQATCLELKTKWGDSLEWYKCDMNNTDDLIKAFEGCYGAFCLTDFTSDQEKMATEEFNIGRGVIDSAVEAKIQRCIFSTHPNVETLTEGKLSVPQSTNKARIEEYAMTEFQGRDINTEFAFVWAGLYLQNFMKLPPMALSINKDGLLENAPLNLNPEAKVPWLNVDDFGGFVLAQFDHWESFKGTHTLAINGYATVPEILDWIAESFGTKGKYNYISNDEFYQLTQNLMLTHGFRFFNEYEAFPNNEEPTKLFADLDNIVQATKRLEWKGFVKTGFAAQITSKIGEVTEFVGEKLGAVKDAIMDTAQQVRENLTSQAE